MPRIKSGSKLPAQDLETYDGRTIPLADPQRITHLQFRRYAGCPICNLHLRSFAERKEELAGAGVREMVVFYSTADELRKYQTELPFDTVADPEKRLYRAFGVENTIRALDPRSWGPAIRGLATRQGRLPGRVPELFGVPADFLIGTDATVLDVKYGAYANDHWSVDEVMGRALRNRARVEHSHS